MLEVIPGILETDWSEIEAKLEKVKPFAKTVHIDLIDGKFAPHKTFLDPLPFSKYKDDFLLELHMMVDNPIEYLEPFSKAGFRRFIGHIERMPSPSEFVAQGQLIGGVGLALDGPTGIEALDNITLNNLDSLLIMTITAGASGQTFQPELLEKVRIARERSFIPIEVDGGINNTTILKARESGATRFVSNSYLFSGEVDKRYNNLHALLEG